jgi:hypothetical protein
MLRSLSFSSPPTPYHFRLPRTSLVGQGIDGVMVYRFKSPVDQHMPSGNRCLAEGLDLGRSGGVGEAPQYSAAGRDPTEEREPSRTREGRLGAGRGRRSEPADNAPPCATSTSKVMWIETGRQKGLRRFVDCSTACWRFRRSGRCQGTRAQAFTLLESFVGIPVAAANLRRELGAAWDCGHDAGPLDENAPDWWCLIMRGKLRTNGYSRGRVDRDDYRMLNQPEIGQLIQWLPNFSRLVGDGVTLYLWARTRRGEIVTMEASEISFESDGLWWKMPKARRKTPGGNMPPTCVCSWWAGPKPLLSAGLCS